MKNNLSFAVFVIFVVIVSSWFRPLASQVPGRENSFAAAAAARAPDAVNGDPVVQRRIRDMVAGIASPGTNERLQFARRVIERHGVDVTTAAGQQGAEQVLREALLRMLADYDTYFRDSAPGATLFRNRGLSSDTSIYAAFAIDAALKDVAAKGLLRAGSVRRVAVIGPGLDFTDKQEGYDFYPLQTIQPFAVIDSLRAAGPTPCSSRGTRRSGGSAIF